MTANSVGAGPVLLCTVEYFAAGARNRPHVIADIAVTPTGADVGQLQYRAHGSTTALALVRDALVAVCARGTAA